MDTLFSIGIGIGLSAACGFRVFVPPLVMSIFAMYGHLPLTPEFQWVGTTPALIAFAVATCIEITAYYVPWIDNLLDTFATPTAIAVGTFITAALLHDTDPLVKWSLAVIAGGGSAGIVQGLTAMLRLSSTTFTAGFGNFIINTIESGGSVLLSVLAVFAPFLAVGLITVLMLLVFQKVQDYISKRKAIRNNI